MLLRTGYMNKMKFRVHWKDGNGEPHHFTTPVRYVAEQAWADARAVVRDVRRVRGLELTKIEQQRWIDVTEDFR